MGKIKYSQGWKEESIDEKIQEMLRLSLLERIKQGLLKGILRDILEKNQERLYGRASFNTVQIIKPKSG